MAPGALRDVLWGSIPLLVVLLGAQPAAAAEPNLAGVSEETSAAAVSPVQQFSDLRPSDWAYQALANLIERYGCVSGTPAGAMAGQRSITRFEAAALLNACLERVADVTDELKALIAALEPERTQLQGRAAALEARVGALESQTFSTTTKLKGKANLVLGGVGFGGSAIEVATNTVNTATQGSQPLTNAVTFNYDVRLTFDTSFNGSDLLRTELRAGDFDSVSNSLGGGGPTTLSTLEVAFQEQSGRHIMGIYKLYYQAPLGAGFTATLGGMVAQEDMLAFWPSVYPDSSVLDVMTMAGAPVAYNYNRGPGAGLWWQRQGWSLSASYVAASGAFGTPASGGLATANARSTATVQLAHQQDAWGLALTYAGVQNGVVPYGTNDLLQRLNSPGTFTNALALSGYWQPIRGGWIPSISAGWGINSTSSPAPSPAPAGSGAPVTSQSWSVGLQWLDALAKGNAAGLAFGQAPFVTAQGGGTTPADANWTWECWYKVQVSDNISVTPAVFYLSRPLGQETPAGQSFNQWGALIKTTFLF